MTNQSHKHHEGFSFILESECLFKTFFIYNLNVILVVGRLLMDTTGTENSILDNQKN